MREWRKKLIGGFREWCCGSTGQMEELYGSACVKLQREERIGAIRRKTRSAYLILLVAGILLLSTLLAQTMIRHVPLRSVERPEQGQPERRLPVKAILQRGGVKRSGSIELLVGPASISEQEKHQILDAFAAELPKKILGENPDLQHIAHDLILDQVDEETGITLNWEADRPELVDGTGAVSCLSPELPQKVVLQAHLELSGVSCEQRIPLRLVTPGEKEKGTVEIAMGRTLERAVLELSASSEGQQVRLPEMLPGGVRVLWRRRSSIPFSSLFLLLILGFFLVWRSRFQLVRSDIRKEREEMAREFPDFLNRLVLLLSAGMVTQAALERISEDYRSQRGGKIKPLYEAILLMEDSILQTNAPLSQELIKLAKQSGLRELARFSSIVSDNLNKGSGLTDKLAAESELLWMNRKKKAQEQGRLAETKLTLPLMILLVILIVLTTAPALMDIGGS